MQHLYNNYGTFHAICPQYTRRAAYRAALFPKLLALGWLTLFAITFAEATRTSINWVKGRSSRRGWHSAVLFGYIVPTWDYNFFPCTRWAHYEDLQFAYTINPLLRLAFAVFPCRLISWTPSSIFPTFIDYYCLDLWFLSQPLISKLQVIAIQLLVCLRWHYLLVEFLFVVTIISLAVEAAPLLFALDLGWQADTVSIHRV